MSGVKMPLIIAIGAVAVAGTVALVRPHATPALRTSSDTFERAPADRSGLGHGITLQGAGYAARDPSPRDGAAGRVVVYVTGEVNRPGVYTVDSRSRVEGALRAASGPTQKADLLAVNLAEPVSDGEKVLVPAKGDPNAAAEVSSASTLPNAPNSSYDSSTTASHGSSRRHHRRSSASTGGRHRRGHRSHKTPPSEPIDINAADATQLEQLPGIGPSLAERIVTFRDINGPYHSTDELLDVSGMTDKRLDAIANYVMVRSP